MSNDIINMLSEVYSETVGRRRTLILEQRREGDAQTGLRTLCFIAVL